MDKRSERYKTTYLGPHWYWFNAPSTAISNYNSCLNNNNKKVVSSVHLITEEMSSNFVPVLCMSENIFQQVFYVQCHSCCFTLYKNSFIEKSLSKRQSLQCPTPQCTALYRSANSCKKTLCRNACFSKNHDNALHDVSNRHTVLHHMSRAVGYNAVSAAFINVIVFSG